MSKPEKLQSILIPNNIDDCHSLIHQLVARVNELQKQRDEFEVMVDELMRRAARNASERHVDPKQLQMHFGDEEDAADAAEGLEQALDEREIEICAHKRTVRQRRDESLPDHLERYTVTAEADDGRNRCPEHGERELIGYDQTERLEFKRPELRVRVTRYPKYACPGHSECGVATPPRTEGLVEGDKYDVSVAAEIVTAKYGYHLPIYRQQDLFAGSGWRPTRSTLLNILMASGRLIRPLAEFLKDLMLTDSVIGTDETRVTLLLPESVPRVDPDDPRSARVHEVFSEAKASGRPSVSGRMWAYRGATIPINVFDFTVSRHRDGPEQMLATYDGVLLGDCYAGFEGIALGSNGRIQRAACSAHARRKFMEARGTYPVECSLFLSWFKRLSDIEDRAKPMTPEDRAALRESEERPIWNAMFEWLDGSQARTVLPKSKLTTAMGYMRNHRDALRLYLSNGRVPMDNNDVEQLMKQVAVGRKNWLFVGSVDAGSRAADFLTLVSSAVRNDLDVWAYIKDVLDQLLAGNTDYQSLRPDVWRNAHPEATRIHRITERRERAERKSKRREKRRRTKQPRR